MSGCTHSIWKTLSAGAALLLMLPSLALGEFGVCPPYSKTFGPDDPPDQILAFIYDLNTRPGGGTVILEPGQHDFTFLNEPIEIAGVVCIRSSSPDQRASILANERPVTFQVGHGGSLTHQSLRDFGEGVGVASGGTYFASDTGLQNIHNSGTAYLENIDGSGHVDNKGQFVLRGFVQGGFFTLTNDAGFAFVEKARFRRFEFCDDLGCYPQGSVSNRNGGVLTLVNTILDDTALINEFGSTAYIYDSSISGHVRNDGILELSHSVMAMARCGVVTDLGYNVVNGCPMSAPTSIEADPQFAGSEASESELSAGSPAIDLIPLELCSETDFWGRVRTDGNNDGIVDCDAGALEYGYAGVEAKVGARPYFWKDIGEIDLSASDIITIYVFSTETFDATQIVFDTVVIEGFGFARDSGGWPGIIDVYRDGLKDYQATWRQSRMAPLSCGYQEHEFSAMTKEGREVRGLLKFLAVGCTQ